MDIKKWHDTWGTITWRYDSEKDISEKTDKLLAAGVDVNMRNMVQGRETPLMKAITRGFPGVVQKLIDAGADVNLGDADGTTPLMEAAKWGKNKIIEQLLISGAKIDMKNFWNKTALMCAAEKNNVVTIQKLIDAGSDLDAQDVYGCTALDQAVMNGHSFDVVKQLIDAGSNIDLQNKDGNTALMHAIFRQFGRIKIAEDSIDYLIAKKANLDIQNNDGKTALFFAVVIHRTEVIEKLIYAGADIELKDKEGMTAYDFAIKESFPEGAELLKKALENKWQERKDKQKKCDAEEEWKKTWGTIDWQKDSETTMIKKAKSFLDSGANINTAILHNYNRTPLMCAVTMEKAKFVDFLICEKADVNKMDTRGFTPLMVATVKGNKEIAEKLLNAKADVTKRRQGVSALDMAKKYGHDDIAKLLISQKNISLVAKKHRGGRI